MATLSSAECRNQCRVVDKLKSAAVASAQLWQSLTVAGGSCQGRVWGCSVVACGGPDIPATLAAGLPWNWLLGMVRICAPCPVAEASL